MAFCAAEDMINCWVAVSCGGSVTMLLVQAPRSPKSKKGGSFPIPPAGLLPHHERPDDGAIHGERPPMEPQRPHERPRDAEAGAKIILCRHRHIVHHLPAMRFLYE